MKYQPIENYGVIGDLNTVALVGLNGSIDFLCLPDFDSPSVFAALLDAGKGGCFQICTTYEKVRHRQMYLPDTNVLLTRFLSIEGVGEITDFMPVEALYPGHVVIRRVTTVRGCMQYRMQCSPRFNYARSAHRTEHREKEVYFTSEGPEKIRLRLVSSVPLEVEEGDAFARFTLKGGETADFTPELVTDINTPAEDLVGFVDAHIRETINYWKNWVSQSTYRGRWAEMVHRSALVLKLMTAYRHGSIVAAPTFSLPEELGGVRNWDYRYTWIRDAAFTVYALLRQGYTREVRDFIGWVEKQCNDIGEAGRLRLMYAIDGRKELHEQELAHLEGYCGSAPVRIGNAAHKQVQLDIYGELLEDRLQAGMLPDALPGAKAKVTSLLNEAIQETRRLAHELTPALLLHFGLETAVRDVCARAENDGLQVECCLQGLENRLHADLERAVYGLVQELLSNQQCDQARPGQ